MKRTVSKAVSIVFVALTLSGCMYRADGIFKQIGKSDYKANFNFMNLFAVADGRLTYLSGAVTFDDRITPVKHTRVNLKKRNDAAVLASTVTDNAGMFSISAHLMTADYLLEIVSDEVSGGKDIVIEPGMGHWIEVVAFRK